MADFRTNIMDFRGFDSSIILILRGGILMSTGSFSESLSQAILVGIMLVGKSGVQVHQPRAAASQERGGACQPQQLAAEGDASLE